MQQPMSEPTADRPEKPARETRNARQPCVCSSPGASSGATNFGQHSENPHFELRRLHAFALLFVIVNANLFIIGWMAGAVAAGVLAAPRRGLLSDFHNLPNRNYLLANCAAKCRARAATTRPSCHPALARNHRQVRERRGDDFANASQRPCRSVKRLTRSSDLLATSAPALRVMLVECTLEQSYIYLKRVPGISRQRRPPDFDVRSPPRPPVRPRIALRDQTSP